MFGCSRPCPKPNKFCPAWYSSSKSLFFPCYRRKIPCSPAQGFLKKALCRSDFFISRELKAEESLLISLIAGKAHLSVSRRERTEDQPAPALVPRLRCSEPGDGPDGVPPILARTIELNEPRVPISELGFTEGYALLDVGENPQKGISMHAAQYTTTPISRALKRVSKLSKAKTAAVSAGGSERRVEQDGKEAIRGAALGDACSGSDKSASSVVSAGCGRCGAIQPSSRQRF